MVQLSDERDLETLRQVSLLLDRENQRLIDKVRQLTAELRACAGCECRATRTGVAARTAARARAGFSSPRAVTDASASAPRDRHTLAMALARKPPAAVEIRHELAPDQRACPACGGELCEMTGQAETSDRITTVKLTYQVEHHIRQKYRCGCNGAVVTAPAPPTLIPGGRYAPAFAVGVAVAKYADHLPLERQVRMMAREGLIVDSQTLWDQLNALARHLEPTYEAFGRRALAAPVIHVDETRWAIMGSPKPAAGTVWTVRTPTEAF